MKKRWSRSGVLAAVLALLLSMNGCGSLDMGIIGGADGPTGIIVGSEPEWPDSAAGDPEEPEEAPDDLSTAGGTEEQPYSNGLPADDISIDGTYNSAEDVSLYLHTFGCLPQNYITKEEAQELGWSGGSVERYVPRGAIGGDKFGNREGALPDGTYYECDIDTIGANSRGAKRLVYSDDGRIYYTEDHYQTFTLLYGEE